MSHERAPHFQVRRDRGCLVITAPGPEIEIDAKDELYALAGPEAAGTKQVVLNLARVVNFKSAILGVLVQFQRKVEQAGGVLKVVCPDPDVLTMFRITRVDLVLDLYPDERLALDAFSHDVPSCGARA